jgi:uncharacterized cupredoxin-like copper-binding protein
MRTLACLIVAAALLGPGVPAASPADTLMVEMREFAFRPAVLRVRAGHPITLRLVNRGQIAHQFEADALKGVALTVSDEQVRLEGLRFEILRLQPGASAAVSFTPRQKGRFPFACTIEGHREAGMVGILETY